MFQVLRKNPSSNATNRDQSPQPKTLYNDKRRSGSVLPPTYIVCGQKYKTNRSKCRTRKTENVVPVSSYTIFYFHYSLSMNKQNYCLTNALNFKLILTKETKCNLGQC